MIFNWFKSKKSVEQTDFDSLKKEIDKWDMEKAKGFVFDVLRDDAKYKTIPNISGDVSCSIEMPNQPVKSFFCKYESCSQVYGDVSMSLNEVGQSEYRNEYTRVAKGVDFTEIVAKKGSDEIYEIDGSEYDFKEESFPSIFHWLAFNSCIVYQELEAKIRNN